MQSFSGLERTASKLERRLRETPYQAYVYGYPHKTAYRPLTSPVCLRELWQGENRRALFLYVHVPFCEMRCGFCNLFTDARPKVDMTARYLATLEKEAVVVREALGDAAFARLAIGGGTPTFLSPVQLEHLFAVICNAMGVDTLQIPASVETSPATAEYEKLRLLRNRGVHRISIGVQSFVEQETQLAARPQKRSTVEEALARIRELRFPVLNIDLMYGLPGQTMATWLWSLRQALAYQPEELYLYPLYMRPLTALGKSARHFDDERLHLYRAGRDLLRSEGYRQISMRMFRAPGSPGDDGPVYCCQTDGMVGLGCGARSYTRALHYSGEYAVAMKGVREILTAYLSRSAESLAAAQYGFHLSGEEQRRRFVLQSLLQCEGFALNSYAMRFGTDVFRDLPELRELESLGLARQSAERLTLTETGLERSDVIGPWLYSEHVQSLMARYEAR